MVDASELIPDEGIFLVDAFEHIFRAMTPNWQDLENQVTDPAVQLRHMEVDHGRREASGKAWAAYEGAELKANRWLRCSLGKGLITAFIFFNGKPLQLPRHGWENAGLLQNGIDSNFVGPDDPINPGPDTEINGVRRPVYFVHSDLVALVEKAFGIAEPPKSRGGRPRKHDWDEGRAFAEKIFAERGDFAEVQNQTPGWQTEADFARAIMEHMSNPSFGNGVEPPFSTAKKFVSDFIKQKRGGRK